MSYLPAASITPQGQLTIFDGNGTQTYNLALSTDWELDISLRTLEIMEKVGESTETIGHRLQTGHYPA